ncbi:MAG: hypothetical protein K6T75_08210 [Acetobacteraceae bacterium]|nr:hypothetical protein [Acetobacteraceae bacterium]
MGGAEAAVHVRGLMRVFVAQRGLLGGSGRRVVALAGIDFEIRRGEIFGLLVPTAPERPPRSRSSPRCSPLQPGKRGYLAMT